MKIISITLLFFLNKQKENTKEENSLLIGNGKFNLKIVSSTALRPYIDLER